MQEIVTLMALIESLDNQDFWFVRSIDEKGVFFYSVREGMAAADTDEPFWQHPLRVLWNDDHTVAIAHNAIPANEDPDRRPLVLMHLAAVFANK